MKRNVPIFGFFIGLFLPMIGVVIMYFLWRGANQSFDSFLISLTRLPGMASKVLTLGLLINLVPFLYFSTKRLDHSMRGVVVATMMYAVLIVLIKFVW